MTLRAESDWQALQQARAYQKIDEFKAIFKERAGIEGTISQAVRAFELRHCRYIGLKKTKLQHIITAAAINIVRLTAMPAQRILRDHLLSPCQMLGM